MATRLVLDELDLDFPALAAGLIVIVVVLVLWGARTLDAAVRIALDEGTIVLGWVVVDVGRRVLVVVGDLRGHCDGWSMWCGYVCWGRTEALNCLRRAGVVWGFPVWRGASLVEGAARVTGESLGSLGELRAGWERLDPK